MRAPSFALVALVLAGCAGSGSTPEEVGYAGWYDAPIDRADSSIKVGVNLDGTVDVLLKDGVAGVYTGSVPLVGNRFSAVCKGSDGQSIEVSGTLGGSGTSRMVSGSVTGEFSSHFLGAFTHPPQRSLFAATYSGWFRGKISGRLYGRVDDRGRFEGAWEQEAGEIALRGTASSNGFLRASGTDAGRAIQLNGAIVATGGRELVLDGIWSQRDSSDNHSGEFRLLSQ
ncbi:MAG: hypothetical protein ACAH95_01250 [Fimbriimonas sp.]